MTSPRPDWYSMVHARGDNFVFADAHVEYRKASLLRAWQFGLADGSSGKAEDDQTAADLACYTSTFNHS